MNKFALKTVFAFSVFALLVGSAFAAEPSSRPHKKLIELGWDIPSTEYVRQHWQEMEANAPFSGIMYDAVAKDQNGAKVNSQALFTADPWKREWFQNCVDNMNACDFQRYHDNFIRINFYPTPFDWADDEAWANVCEKGAICAWVARETGGNLCLDFESYGSQMFRHDAATGRTFAESKALARRRGAEFGGAIVVEYPDVVLLCLWMNSCNFAAGRSDDPDTILLGSAYGLLPSFIDGLLDAAKPETKLVDGCEFGYYMNGAAQYDRAACDMLLATGPAAALVSPENRAKYRAQVQAGFGYYLDMYSNPEGSKYYRGPEPGETRFDRLVANLNAAWNAADEYVWVYGEQKRWWAPENAKSDDDWTSWEEALPGITEFVYSLTDPVGALEALKAKALNDPDAKNLLANGDFSQIDENGMPKSWKTWQIESHATGKFSVKDEQAVLTGMTTGCFIGSIAVKPGERYLVRVSAKKEGDAVSCIRVRWQDADTNWVHESDDVIVALKDDAEKDEQGFSEIFCVVTVPEGAFRLVPLLSASGADPNAVVTYDDAKAYRVK